MVRELLMHNESSVVFYEACVRRSTSARFDVGVIQIHSEARLALALAGSGSVAAFSCLSALHLLA